MGALQDETFIMLSVPLIRSRQSHVTSVRWRGQTEDALVADKGSESQEALSTRHITTLHAAFNFAAIMSLVIATLAGLK